MSVNTILRHRDSGTGGSLCGWCLSSEVLSMSLKESKDPSRRYYINGSVSSYIYDAVPLIWLQVDTVEIREEAFCGKAAAFGCDDGRVIILDLTRLDFPESIIM